MTQRKWERLWGWLAVICLALLLLSGYTIERMDQATGPASVAVLPSLGLLVFSGLWRRRRRMRIRGETYAEAFERVRPPRSDWRKHKKQERRELARLQRNREHSIDPKLYKTGPF